MEPEPQNPSTPANAKLSPPAEHFPGQGVLGSFLLLTGVSIAVMAFIDRTGGLPFDMPQTWYFSPWLWYFFGFISFLAGMKLLRSHPVDNPRWKPEQPGQRFRRVVVYTRPDCHLCDQAKDTLWSYQKWMTEIEEIDITKRTDLWDRFSQQVPVVEIDDQIRFRGQVNEILLRRLIDATPPSRESPP